MMMQLIKHYTEISAVCVPVMQFLDSPQQQSQVAR
jgi:hypothetical protein